MSIHASGYVLKCDSCGLQKVFVSSEAAAKWARSMGWQEVGRDHRCQECTQNRTDNQRLNHKP